MSYFTIIVFYIGTGFLIASIIFAIKSKGHDTARKLKTIFLCIGEILCCIGYFILIYTHLS